MFKRSHLLRTLRRIGLILAFALIAAPFVWVKFGAWGMGWTGWAVALVLALIIAVIWDGEKRMRFRRKPRSDLKYDD